MKKRNRQQRSSLEQYTIYQGETIEQRIDRMIYNKEPIKDAAPIIYTERAEGVKPEYDIRTDRFDLAIEAMDVANKSKLGKREERLKTEAEKKEADLKAIKGGKGESKDGGTESTQATESK